MDYDYDVVIIGAGPGGSTLASYLAQANYRTAILEKAEFPRFKIGESLLPYSREPLEEIGFWPKLNNDQYITKFGAKFLTQNEGECFRVNFSEGLTDDHPHAYEVQREKFDTQLLDHAVSSGASLFQPEDVTAVDFADDYVTTQTNSRTLTSRFIVDASGRSGMMAQKHQTRHTDTSLSHTAIFSHFNQVARDDGELSGDIIVSVLEGISWSWVIPFRDGSSSAGVVVQSSEYRDFKSNPEQLFWNKISCCKDLQKIMSRAKQIRDFEVVSNYSYNCDSFSGKRWISIGDALGFIDPVFSSGVHLAICSAKFASGHLMKCLEKNTNLESNNTTADYEHTIRKGMTRFRWAINLFYSNEFEKQMKRILKRENSRKSFTSLLAGDIWNDDNLLFRLNSI